MASSGAPVVAAKAAAVPAKKPAVAAAAADPAALEEMVKRLGVLGERAFKRVDNSFEEAYSVRDATRDRAELLYQLAEIERGLAARKVLHLSPDDVKRDFAAPAEASKRLKAELVALQSKEKKTKEVASAALKKFSDVTR